MLHHIGTGLLGLFFDRFGCLAGFLRGTGGGPAGLRGPFGGGVLLFDLLFLLPAGQRVAGRLGIFLQRLLVQCIDIGLFQLPLRLGCLAVGFQLVAAVALLDQMHTCLHGFFGLVGALHAHVVIL